ncbi:MAG: hypothetical protein INR72_14235 [Williamsia herbipolensis]|nr:hypothetical protein [Williamsia herbipolensis]
MNDDQPTVLTMLSTSPDGSCTPDGYCHLPTDDLADDADTGPHRSPDTASAADEPDH